MTVGPDHPGLGCAATPTGLSTTTMSSSSWTTLMPSTCLRHDLDRNYRRRRRSTSSHAPARTRSDLTAAPPSTLHATMLDQVGGATAGEPEQPRQGGVEALALQTVRNRQAPAVAHPSTRSGPPTDPSSGRSPGGDPS